MFAVASTVLLLAKARKHVNGFARSKLLTSID
jgi:hypothetical protein